MEKIINPVDRKLIEKELTEDIFIRKTNNGNNEIYITDYHRSPNIMLEIGRLRELTFREAGGGTGKEIDIDIYDTCDVPYQQLLVWNPRDKEIIGGYRYIKCKNACKSVSGDLLLATAELFTFSEKFLNEYFNSTIELGRSFVQPAYQPTIDIRKGMYSLDNIWDGLGAVVIDNPDVKFFFGKMTMFPKFNPKARDLILYFLNLYFPDNEKLVMPKIPLQIKTDVAYFNSVLYADNYKDNYRLLVQEVRNLKENIPPLFNAYMNLSSTMKVFGTALNEEFGSVEETGILIAIDDIYDMKKLRHLESYQKNL